MPQGIVQRVEISGLFGRFDYSIPKSGEMHSPAILYGDNGVGKSTILNLIFHLLSSAGNKGHRTAIHKIPFDSLKVELSNGSTLTAVRSDDYEEDELITFQVWQNKSLIAEWLHSTQRTNYRVEVDDGVVREWYKRGMLLTDVDSPVFKNLSHARRDDGVKRGEKEYLAALSHCAPTIFYLNADRKLDSDEVADPSDELELRQILNHRELKRITDILQASRGISLKQALVTASRWVTRRAVRGANRGSENVHTVYETVIGQIATDYHADEFVANRVEIADLLAEIAQLEKDAKAFARYELTSELGMAKFRDALNTQNDRADAISARLIAPYAKSLGSRLEAIRPVYDVLNKFVTVINEFLSRKSINYALSQGFFILDDSQQPLEPSQLSSGEQQLLLIFSYVLSARDSPSVFIIDEPEISLNVKWQRKMVDSLLQVASGSDIQFILASHSIELLTQHEDSVIEVGD